MSSAPTARSARELAAYGGGLAEKPEIVGLNKIDALDPAAIARKMPRAVPRRAAGTPGAADLGRQRRRHPAGARGARRRDRGLPTPMRPPLRRALATDARHADRPTPTAAPRASSPHAGRSDGRTRRSPWRLTPGCGARRGAPARRQDRLGAAGRRATASIRRAWLDALADDVARCRRRGQEVIIVSSGAIALGRRHLGLRGGRSGSRKSRRPPRPARSASRMPIRRCWRAARHHRRAGAADARRHRGAAPLSQRPRHVRATAGASARCRWSTRTTRSPPPRSASATTTGSPRASPQMISADMLVLLSDIDGLYTADPRTDPAARHIPQVREITPEIEAMAGRRRPATARAAW